MNLFTYKNEYQMPLEVKRRLTVAIVFSVLVHVCILSLQFAMPNAGVSSLDASFSKHRSEQSYVPDITIDITGATTLPPPAAEIPPPLILHPVVEPKRAPPSVPPTTSHGIVLVAPVPVTSLPPIWTPKNDHKRVVRHKRKSASSITAAKSHKVIATEIPDLIVQDVLHDDSFVVAVRDPEEVKKDTITKDLASTISDSVKEEQGQSRAEIVPEQKIVAPVADAEASVASVARYEADESLHQQKEAENLRRTEAMLVTNVDDTSAKEKIIQKLEEDNRQHADILRAQSAAVAAAALKQQLDAEELRRQAQQDAANAATLAWAEKQRTENMRQVDENLKQQLQSEQAQRELERKESLHAMAFTRLQNEERQEQEKRALQKALMQRQQQARQLSEQQAAQAQLAAQAQQAAKIAQAAQAAQAVKDAEATQFANQLAKKSHTDTQNQPDNAAGQTSDDDMFGTRGNRPGADAGNTSKSAFVLPKSLLSSDLANRSRESAQGLGLLPGRPPLPLPDDKVRRHTVFNSVEKDVQVRMYADSWKQKIERNGNLNYSQSSSNKARGDPLVSVSIRSDGSVEQVTILRSSGRDDLDQAVRNIVRLNARYAAFPPSIAAQYDVLEIRRIWSFDDNLRIIEELR